ncbi:hypothetical protein Pan258_50290 [Symmachiella dynata]|uniref:hypothetical protein n=1 Tax=Symmachiella dynata TaxID=2527995 RepID=UPI00118A6832|nr:hypothetical protein [Symmachiella dynata]QDT50946.1 hypothetical protein Pan258_50290 [Symmachiella dynata]
MMLRSHNLRQAMRYSAMTAGLVALALLAAESAFAQNKTTKPDPANTLAGKIKSVEKMGRTLVLSIETEDGETVEQLLTTRTPLVIKGDGDSGFLRRGAVVYTKAYQTKDKKLFGKEFKVYLDGSRFRGVKKGKTDEVLEVMGVITQLDKEQMAINIGRGGPGIVQLEEGYQVKIESANHALIVPGAGVVLTGRPTRGRFKATGVEVNLENPLTAEKYFAAQEKGSKRGRRRSRGSSTASKSDKKSEGDSVVNPFAEIDKKKDK